ncbi:MAG TPA: ABC transporter substrate-binding protein [Stellaceae bacterium]|nr:ABC transporter substrate-binding protein [Stellaceae bacterium]
MRLVLRIRRRGLRRLAALVSLGLISLGLVAPGLGQSAAAETITLRYGQAFSAAESVYSLPILVAQREHYFAREGLAVRDVFVPGGGDKMIAALSAGTVDLTHVATAFLISADLAGSDAVAIAAEFDNPIYSLVARPEIKTFADLKGRIVGLADEAGSVAFATRALLRLKGVADRDYWVDIVSGTPERMACLERARCDAVPLGQPQDFAAISAGYRLLGRTNEAVPAFLYTVTAAERAWAEQHRDAVIGYVRALAAAFRFIRDPANRDAVAKLIADASKSSAQAARATLALYLDPDRKVLPRRGEIDLDGMQQVIQFMAEAGLVQRPLPPPQRFVALQYLHAAGIE